MGGIEWYDKIAKKLGGYKKNWSSSKRGTSGEEVFEKRLIEYLPKHGSVLDIGCGHGEFTIKMAQYTKNIIGMDFSKEMIKCANKYLSEYNISNVKFLHGNTKGKNNLKGNEFDLIYDRRGPTSIIYNHSCLKPGGKILGIHSAELDRVRKLLYSNGFIDISIEEFEAKEIFDDEHEFAKYLSRIPGNKDYTYLENKEELRELVKQHTFKGNIIVREWRYVWEANKFF
ncbi:MAG: class I SAM-dependent methyltransferase [Maledivibacter sp.]|jgi:SAM-dependent methyltransferase|nr:class I SAM-dependent methyltransferase [Maledivibacter sp.]